MSQRVLIWRGWAAVLVLSLLWVLGSACQGAVAYVGIFGEGLALYVADEVTSTSRLVTAGPVDTSPAWSPDGDRIAFVRWVGESPDIFAVRADGTELVRLTDNPGQDFEPTWSPDGASIAYLSERDGVVSAYVMDADGANPRPLSGLPEGIGSLDWSPTGREIMFDRIIDYAYRIFILDLATGLVREVPNLIGSGPRWSPDGQWIAFAGDAQIGIVHPDGTGLRWLTSQPGHNEHPSWSPDGMRIAYQSDDLGRNTICVVGVATGTFFRIAEFGSSPDWSPLK